MEERQRQMRSSGQTMAVYMVTGGAGFIGSHIVEELVRRGEQVLVLDNLSTGRRENLGSAIDRVEFVEGDIRDLDLVQWAMNGVDYVLHEAALASVPQSMANPVATNDVNVGGTLNVLEAARAAGVKRVVLASSCAVYGDSDDLPLREMARPRPLSPYAASKLAGEIYFQTYYMSFGLPTVALRYFNVYGPRQNPRGDYAAAIPKFVERMRAGQPPIIFGDGKQTRDFVAVQDIVRANLLACERPQAVGQVLNVASGKRVTVLEVVSALNKLMGTPFVPEFQPARAGDILHSGGDASQMAGLLGFRAETSLMDGLAQLVGG